MLSFRSHHCLGSTTDGNSCTACVGTIEEVKKVMEVTSRRTLQQRRSTLSHLQLCQRLDSIDKIRQREAFKYLNAAKALKRLRVHTAHWNELLELIGSNDVPALHRVLRNAWSWKLSVERTVLLVHNAINEEYHAKNFTDLELDLASIVHDIGGSAVTHALHNSPFALPSRNTIAQHNTGSDIRVSTGKTIMTDMYHNLDVVFAGTDPLDEVGMTMCIDELACDDRLGWIQKSDEIVGLCHEHVSCLETVKAGSSLDVMHNIASAIRREDVHVAREITVIALGRNDIENYHAKPLLALTSCKKGSFEDMALNMEKALQAFRLHPQGQARQGEIWSIASDGDPKRRNALYLLCNVRELKPDDKLFKHLGHLPGLNLWMGRNFETQDIDWRHLFKRLDKLLCTREGVLINDTVINKNPLAIWLERLTDVDWSKRSLYHLLNPAASRTHAIELLLNRRDPQDVPRAIKLLSLISDLRKVDRDDMGPSELQTHNTFCLLGEMVDALLEPFINTTYSLSEQIVSLVKFAHILYALYKKHETAFIPTHLYTDFQCTFRTAINRVARTKELKSNRRVLLCLLGDDILEQLFGRIRMTGGHYPNVAIDEFGHRATKAIRAGNVFHDHPKWEQSSVRLSLNRSRDVDHIKPRDWRGELQASSCDLLKCWREGVRLATDTLLTYGLHINFEQEFLNWRHTGIDLLRPSGGKYPGISAEVDRSLGDIYSPDTITKNDIANLDKKVYSFTNFDAAAALEAEQKANANAVSQPIDQFITLEGGKKVHKKSTLRIIMDPTYDIDRYNSHDRLVRVQCFSSPGGITSSIAQSERAIPLHDILPENKLMSLGSVFATLISICQNGVSLAVLQCTSIKHSSGLLECAPVDEICQCDSSYDIGGQILELVPLNVTDQSFATSNYVWTGAYITLNKVTKSNKNTSTSSSARMANINFSLNGRLIYPYSNGEANSIVVSDILEYRNVSDLSELAVDKMDKLEKTWEINVSHLMNAQTELWRRVREDDELKTRSKIPVTGATVRGKFPYAEIFYSDSIKPLEDGPHPCNICRHQVSRQDRQNHMGKHILHAMLGVPANPLHIDTVSTDYPCGFCGQSMNNKNCEITNVTHKVYSDCDFGWKLSMRYARRISDSKPCTNVPLTCAICGGYQWKYNMMQHLKDRHSENWEAFLTHNETFRCSLEISIEEQQKLGIPDECQIAGFNFTRGRSKDRHSRDSPLVKDTREGSPPRLKSSNNVYFLRSVPRSKYTHSSVDSGNLAHDEKENLPLV